MGLCLYITYFKNMHRKVALSTQMVTACMQNLSIYDVRMFPKLNGHAYFILSKFRKEYKIIYKLSNLTNQRSGVDS